MSDKKHVGLLEQMTLQDGVTEKALWSMSHLN